MPVAVLEHLPAEAGEALGEVGEHVAHGRAAGFDLARAADLGAQRGRDANPDHVTPSWPALAELDVVDVVGDGRVVAADRALGVAAEADLRELRLERVEEEQAADERLADPERELQRLVGLERADDPGQDAEDAALGAARGQLRRRRLREEAAVARPLLRLEDRRLALEAEDRAVDDRDAVPHGGVVQEVAGGEVVGPVDDHVPALAEDPVDVLGGQPLLEDLHGDVGVERLDRALGGLGLRLAEALGRVDDLALEVRVVDDVVVDDPDVPTPAAAR